MLNDINYWQTTAVPPAFPAAPLPDTVDVAVVGAGYSGLSAARTLAKAGARVVVLETETVGWGASTRNGGMVLTGQRLDAEGLVRKYGRERAGRMFRLSLDAIDAIERLVTDDGIECDFSRCGHLEVAWKASHFDGYVRAAEFLEKTFGHSMRVVPRADLRSEIGSEMYYGGLVDERSAGVNPARFTWELARLAHAAGAAVHEHTAVSGVERRDGHFVLTTSRGALAADRVFVGTGAYTGREMPALRRRIVPIGSYVIATAPLPDALARELSPHNRMIFDSKTFLYYFRLTPDNRMLFGGRAACTPATPASTLRSAPLLRRDMLEVYPQLEDVPIDYVWGGSVDFTFDMMPHAGAFDGLHVAVGFGGHGVAIATYLGQVVARRMIDPAADNPFDGLPFPAVPFYTGNPLLHLPLALAYYKVMDWLS